MSDTISELSREELLARYASRSAVAPAEATRRSPFKFLDAYEVDDAETRISPDDFYLFRFLCLAT